MNANIILVSLTMLFIGCSEEIADRSIQLLNTDATIDLINALDERMRLLHGRIHMLKRSDRRMRTLHGRIRMMKRSDGRIHLVDKSNGKIIKLKI